jgi:hypothetical protein
MPKAGSLLSCSFTNGKRSLIRITVVIFRKQSPKGRNPYKIENQSYEIGFNTIKDVKMLRRNSANIHVINI